MSGVETINLQKVIKDEVAYYTVYKNAENPWYVTVECSVYVGVITV